MSCNIFCCNRQRSVSGWMTSCSFHPLQFGTYGPRPWGPSTWCHGSPRCTCCEAYYQFKQARCSSGKCIFARVTGSLQWQGIDYVKSFAPVILAVSIKSFKWCCPSFKMFTVSHQHLQCLPNMPGAVNAQGQRLWQRIFPEYFCSIRLVFLNIHNSKLFFSVIAVEYKPPPSRCLCMCKGAMGPPHWSSHLWRVLTPNGADQCIYKGLVNVSCYHWACYWTIAFLLAKPSIDAYKNQIVSKFKTLEDPWYGCCGTSFWPAFHQ